ncbi:MAG TPA: AAA family ATPase [Candidatus Binataceae bacterium]|nr:AAA family ATPase [Candidatus Binataceae bacterium]
MPSVRADASLPPVIAAMLTPAFYNHPVSGVEFKQTHTSYVLLAGDFVYKVRKAVRFAFIDCSTLDRRLALCQREVELNRRLSPHVYLGIVAISRNGTGFTLDQSTSRSRDIVEFAVKMRRLPEDRRLDSMIKRNAVLAEDIKNIADTIGSFHAGAPNSHSWDYGAAANVWRMTIGNLVEIEQLRPDTSFLGRIAQIESYSRRYIAAHWELLNKRAHEGRIREGHGDLRADAVYLTSNGIRIIDCLEFDERLRYGDIANEMAFLAMDIDRLGHPELARQLISHFASDLDMTLLVPFYKSYRATVRAKVELLRSRQEDCSAEDRQRALAGATQLLELALSYASGAKALLIVCGASGTGKSTLAAVLSEHLGFDLVSSDLVRKRSAGIEPNTSAATHYNRGIYTPEFTRQVYDTVLAEAKMVLSTGKGVIVDATFGKQHQRQSAIETAKKLGVEPLFIECCADKDVVIQRLVQREHDSQRVSDAGVEIYLTQLKEFEPLVEIPAAWHQIADTSEDLGTVALEIERRIYFRKS